MSTGDGSDKGKRIGVLASGAPMFNCWFSHLFFETLGKRCTNWHLKRLGHALWPAKGAVRAQRWSTHSIWRASFQENLPEGGWGRTSQRAQLSLSRGKKCMRENGACSRHHKRPVITEVMVWAGEWWGTSGGVERTYVLESGSDQILASSLSSHRPSTKGLLSESQLRQLENDCNYMN